MKKILLYNPAITSMNLGDEIIVDSAKQALAPLLEDSFVISVSTHLPVSRFFAKYLRTVDKRIVCGTNLLRNYFKLNFRQWDINLLNVKLLAPCTLLGVGWHKDSCRLSPITAYLYKTILDKNALHSVRDSYTKEQLEKLGFTNVVNTGCPTMWTLTPEFCSEIPKNKADEVVYTLTDYSPDKEKDLLVIGELKKAYKKVYVWLQGVNDYEYAKKLEILDHVELIGPSLKAYDDFLKKHDVDYIGTRLHGGIRALQHKKRTMIIAVDGRALAKKEDFNLPVVERASVNVESLRDIIYGERATEILIPQEEIDIWKKSIGLL